MKRTLSLLLATLVFLYALCNIVALGMAVHEASVVRELLSDLERISAPEGVPENLFRLASRHSGSVKLWACTAETCTAEIYVDNGFIHWIGTAPKTVLSAQVTIRQNQAPYLHVSLSVIKGAFPRSGAVVAIASLTQLADPGDPAGPPFWVVFRGRNAAQADSHLDVRATASERREAFALNLSCFYRPGGCKDAMALAPAWWVQFQRQPKLPPPE
jgi:hypothetical protein